MPDNRHIVLVGNEAGRPTRTFMVDVSGGKPAPVTPEGVRATIPSPDGKYLVGSNDGGAQMLFPVAGGRPRLIPNLNSTYKIAQWSRDGRSLFVYRLGEVPLMLYRADIVTGEKKLLRELMPTDHAGVVTISPVVTDPDSSAVAYSYYQTLSALYVISGIR